MNDFSNELFAELPDAVAIVAPQGHVLQWNAAAERTFGYSRAEAVGRGLVGLLAAANNAGEFERHCRRARENGHDVTETLHGRKDRSLLNVSISSKAVLDAAGQCRYLLCTMRDITLLQAGRDAKMVEARYRDLLESTPDAIVIGNATGRIVYVNAHAEQVFGYGRQELIGATIETLLPQRYRAAHTGHRGAFFAQPRTRAMGANLALYGQRKDGREFPVEISLCPLETDEGLLVMSAVRDITDRYEARRRADRKFRDLLESAPDAMVIVNERGEIVLVNSQAVRLFGWSAEELLGRNVETLMPARFAALHPAHRGHFWSNPKVRSMGVGLELQGLRKDGVEFPVEISLSPIQTDEGLLVASAIRDATERRRFEQTLQQASRLKSEFLANMSHELRTPLNGILGLSELMVDERVGSLNAKQREFLNDILGCGRHLLQLINDILDLSKIEAGKMEVYAQPFRPAELIEEAVAMVAPLARNKNIEIRRRVDAAIGTLELDVHKLRQVLLNLLSNAVKFTDPGGWVQIEAALEDDSLRLEVRDTGIGMRSEDLALLFVEFQQLDSGSNRRFPGSGLGLALTRKLVAMQGGDIQVRSEVGQGSTFTVRLPTTV